MISITPIANLQASAALSSTAASLDIARASQSATLSYATQNTASPASSLLNQTASQNTQTTSPSSTFLAQLYGQQNTGLGTVSLTTSFARFTPAPTYDTLVSYSFVKYKPSFAGLPQSSSTLNTPASQSETTPTSPAENLQAYSATQSRNQLSVSFAGDSALTIAG